MVSVLSQAGHPLVVMGDFNTDWVGDESRALAEFSEQLGLHAYAPEHTGLGTYKNGSKRLDWILLSNDLEFVKFEVLEEMVSDHKAVLARIRPAPP